MKRMQLSDHFTCSGILLFSLPSIGMQLVDNTYQVADGFFISNYIGSSAFAAENLIFPPLSVIVGVGLMFGSGATALISQHIGEGDQKGANNLLSLAVSCLTGVSILLSILLFFGMPMIARAVGADEVLLPYCVEYGRILAICMPFMLLNSAFHSILIVAERPGLGLAVSIINAVSNIVMDWILIAVFGLGLKGAALATGLSWAISAMIPLLFFMNKSNSMHFVLPQWDGKSMAHACYNGSSEMLEAISYALIAILFNSMLLRYAGEKGVASYAVSEYVTGIFVAIFYGISMSINPVVGYHKGENNREELRRLWKDGILLMGGIGLLMSVLSIVLAPAISALFVGYDSSLMEMSIEALRIISTAFLLSGIAMFASAYFTGMGDGTASLAVAGTRSFAFPLVALLILPRFLGRMGIWLVTPLAEVAAIICVLLFYGKYRKREII